MKTFLGFPTPVADAVYRGPTRFIAGARSHYVQDEHRPLIGRLFPDAELTVIAGAGRWPHVELPAEFLAHVRSFLGNQSA